jgi:hypothetical protein
MSWEVELQRKSRNILQILRQLCSTPSFRITGISVSNTTSLAQPMDVEIIKKNFKALYRAKLANYILEAIQENLLTSPSAAKEVSARTDLLLAVQFTVAVNHKNTPGYTRSIPPTSLTVKKHMRVQYVIE